MIGEKSPIVIEPISLDRGHLIGGSVRRELYSSEAAARYGWAAWPGAVNCPYMILLRSLTAGSSPGFQPGSE
jgi:hypothetical protein